MNEEQIVIYVAFSYKFLVYSFLFDLPFLKEEVTSLRIVDTSKGFDKPSPTKKITK